MTPGILLAVEALAAPAPLLAAAGAGATFLALAAGLALAAALAPRTVGGVVVGASAATAACTI